MKKDKLGNKLKTGCGPGPRPWRWKPGQSGNPDGRPRIPEEIRKLKEETLEKAIVILADLIADKKYLDKLQAQPADLIRLLETAYDRFGLPKVSRNELSVDTGMAERLRRAREKRLASQK